MWAAAPTEGDQHDRPARETGQSLEAEVMRHAEVGTQQGPFLVTYELTRAQV
jgi:hypothetical protein